jgi:hypothetical protein
VKRHLILKACSKGKLERWYRVVRQQFLSELTSQHLQDLDSLNIALWAWVEKVYRTREHSVLKCTPLARWQKDVEQMRTLGPYAHDLDELSNNQQQCQERFKWLLDSPGIGLGRSPATTAHFDH